MARPQKDLTGLVVHSWTVLYRNGATPDGRMPLWRCRCVCGAERDIRAGNLRNGLSKSCGCKPYAPRALRSNRHAEPGELFGRLLILERVGPDVLCRCCCDNVRWYKASNILSGKSKSCGCWRKDYTAFNFFSHGMTEHPAYNSWVCAKDRCRNPNNKDYALYGGRGISFSEKWEDFNDFWRDLGPTWFEGATIDRVKHNGNYEPGNCRWLTIKAQQHNKRTNVRVETILGNLSLTELAQLAGVSYKCMHQRLKAGWPLERLLTG